MSQLSQSGLTSVLATNITTPLGFQNTATRVTEIVQDIIDSMLNTTDGGIVSGNTSFPTLTASTFYSGGTPLSAIINSFSGTSANLWSASTGTNSIIANNNTGNLAKGARSVSFGNSNVVTLNGTDASVLGGKFNSAMTNYSTVIGGQLGRTTGAQSSVLGGFQGFTSGVNSSVIGGVSLSATNSQSTVIGGSNNLASGTESQTLGSNSSVASRQRAVIVGGV